MKYGFAKPGKKMNINEIATIIDDARITCDCSGRYKDPQTLFVIRGSTIKTRNHPGGVELVGFQERQWVWFECQGCKYEWALWKLINRWMPGCYSLDGHKPSSRIIHALIDAGVIREQ